MVEPDPPWPFQLELEDELYEAVWIGLGAGIVEPSNRCDHSLRLASQWASANSIDWNTLAVWLRDRGAGCDCEILLNVVPDDDEED